MFEQLSLLPATDTEIYSPTLYLLQDAGASPKDLRRALRRSSEQGEEFQVRNISVEGIPGVAAYGYIGATGKPPWLGALNRLVDEPVELTNRRAGAAVLLPVAGRPFAVCFGFGHLLLEAESLSSSFGMDYMRRVVDPGSIKELTHTRMDTRVYTDRSSTARGQHAREFELDEYGEIFSRMTGTAWETGLTAERDPRSRRSGLRVSGGASLKIPLAVDATHLVADLRTIAATLGQEPNPGLDLLSRIDALPTTDPLVKILDERLAEALDSPDGLQRITFAPPDALHDRLPESTAVRIRLPGRPKYVVTQEVTAETFRDLLRRHPAATRLEALRKATIQLVSDIEGDEPVGGHTSALRWVAAEVTLNDGHYIRHENKWRRIGADHLKFIDTELRMLFEESRRYETPSWPTRDEAAELKLDDANEGGYNQLLGQRLGWAVLDKAMIRCALHPGGFEAADLVSPDGTLMHVKRAKGSDALSHLGVQGLVSADALRTEDANSSFVAAVTEKSPGFPQEFFRPRRVVFAIALRTGAELTPDSLFTMSKISLLKTARALRRMGVEVDIQGIDYQARAVEDRRVKQQKKAQQAQTAAGTTTP
ncbi:DUF6119 family protein [Kitasatospora sp. NPDC036755]|uniref:DUF6119 family protein n=1 Tax=Kitasatospora sp. NPDC036755 TaxID=3154600 RepID=UPI0034069D62